MHLEGHGKVCFHQYPNFPLIDLFASYGLVFVLCMVFRLLGWASQPSDLIILVCLLFSGFASMTDGLRFGSFSGFPSGRPRGQNLLYTFFVCFCTILLLLNLTISFGLCLKKILFVLLIVSTSALLHCNSLGLPPTPPPWVCIHMVLKRKPGTMVFSGQSQTHATVTIQPTLLLVLTSQHGTTPPLLPCLGMACDWQVHHRLTVTEFIRASQWALA